MAAAAAVVVTAVAAAAAGMVATAVAVAAETAGDHRFGAGSASWLLLEALQLLIALKSAAHQTITHIKGLRSTRFRLRSRKLATQILAMASCQIAMKAIERT